MIYNKDAAFPYPILSRTSSSYKENYFSFDVDRIEETKDSYIIPFTYKISTPFIEQLLKDGKATLLFIAQSNDNYFERLSFGQNKVELKKKRLSLSKRTKLQLQIQTLEEISFSESNDLNDFYHMHKDRLIIRPNSLLGYSDEVVFEGSEVRPLELFEQSVRENLEKPFKIELTSEVINLVFKDRKYTFDSGNIKKSLKNMYFYLGLNRALSEFIQEYGAGEEFINLLEMPVPEKGLHIKLRDLMLNKNIVELDFESLDSVIQQMSDGIIEKFIDGVKEMSENGN